MRLSLLSSLLLFISLSLASAPAQQGRSGAGNPFGFVQSKCDIPDDYSPSTLKEQIATGLAALGSADGLSYFCLAARMERVGDYRASEFYEKAVLADPNQPNYELFYGDYLRNIRGASIYPLFPQAEHHYFLAIQKLPAEPERNADEQETYKFILRGLAALYQRDGVALVTRSSAGTNEATSSGIPVMSLASINRFSRAPYDLDREAYIRDYTAEAQYIESKPVPINPFPYSGVLGRDLSQAELAAVVRLQTAFETLDRLRFRYKDWPVIDLFYTHRQTTDNQIPNPFCITTTSAQGCETAGQHPFSDLWLNTYGINLQKPFNAFKVFDFSINGVLDGVDRRGLIPFASGNNEHILEFGGQFAMSHFFGPDKGTTTIGYTYQTIHPEITTQPPSRDRYRRFVNGTLDYQLLRPLPGFGTAYDRRFQNRGWDFYGGFLTDKESYPTPNVSIPTPYVNRDDYFVGTSLRGIWHGRFDFTVQPTWFLSTQNQDASQKNRQYQTTGSILYRIVDEERHAGITEAIKGLHLAFLHVVVPFNSDTSLEGLDAYENRRIGIQFDTKFFTYSRWTTFFASAGYYRVNFYNLNKGENTFSCSLSMGF